MIINRQVACLNVAANRDGQTTRSPLSDFIFNILYTYTTAPDVRRTKNNQIQFFLNILVICEFAWHNGTNWFHRVVQQGEERSALLPRRTGSNT